MVDAAMSAGSEPASVQVKPTGFNRLLFEQELNEVYLLLDFVSGRPDKHLSSLNDIVSNPYYKEKPSDEDARKDKGNSNIAQPLNIAQPETMRYTDCERLSSSQAIELVCSLKYPPEQDQTESDRGKDAAFLLLLKDALNGVAFPARGLTIAYTTMFTADRSRTSGSRGGSSGAGGPGADPTSPNTSRVDAADKAFPSLVESARQFAWWRTVLIWIGVVITAISALLIWLVTYGAQLAAGFDEAKRNDTESAARVYNQLEVENKDQKKGTPDISKICKISNICFAQASADGKKEPPQTEFKSDAADTANSATSAVQVLCDDYAYQHARLCAAVGDVDAYRRSLVFTVAEWILPIHERQPPMAGQDAGPGGRQEDARSVAGVLATMSNYLLPILFGVVGTITALVRDIQAKITDSLLSPRDKTLALIRLPLGMVAGVMVGLFFNPTRIAEQTRESIGLFTISASGIAFLAGYGAEAFFAALDGLVAKLFGISDASARPAPSKLP